MNPLAMDDIPNLQTVLTERQLEVVGLLANGNSSTQTSHILSINVSTVKQHIRRAIRRVGAQTRTQLVVLYVVWKLKAP
jgi:LuxR family maltose regulon positive regulatory protein